MNTTLSRSVVATLGEEMRVGKHPRTTRRGKLRVQHPKSEGGQGGKMGLAEERKLNQTGQRPTTMTVARCPRKDCRARALPLISIKITIEGSRITYAIVVIFLLNLATARSIGMAWIVTGDDKTVVCAFLRRGTSLVFAIGYAEVARGIHNFCAVSAGT